MELDDVIYELDVDQTMELIQKRLDSIGKKIDPMFHDEAKYEIHHFFRSSDNEPVNGTIHLKVNNDTLFMEKENNTLIQTKATHSYDLINK